MKLFDLEAFKAGATAIDGRGTIWHYIGINERHSNLYSKLVAATENGFVEFFSLDGKYNNNQDSPLNLFMLPQKKSGWVNLYKTSNLPDAGCTFHSKEVALRHVDISRTLIDTIEIHWEE